MNFIPEEYLYIFSGLKFKMFCVAGIRILHEIKEYCMSVNNAPDTRTLFPIPKTPPTPFIRITRNEKHFIPEEIYIFYPPFRYTCCRIPHNKKHSIPEEIYSFSCY